MFAFARLSVASRFALWTYCVSLNCFVGFAITGLPLCLILWFYLVVLGVGFHVRVICVWVAWVAAFFDFVY